MWAWIPAIACWVGACALFDTAYDKTLDLMGWQWWLRFVGMLLVIFYARLVVPEAR